jgi:hypothetical protein
MASEIATLPANSFVFVAAFDSNEMMPYEESASYFGDYPVQKP